MKKPPYYSIPQMLKKIRGLQGEGIRRLYSENAERFKRTPGSVHNHQAWPGGYHDHIMEIMNIGLCLYSLFASFGRPLPYKLSDVLLVTFAHDLEKPWKYELDARGDWQIIPSMRDKTAQHQIKIDKLAEYGVELTALQDNAIRYAEGEISDYTPHERKAQELAAICHMADFGSARGMPNYPKAVNDPWAPTQFVCRGKVTEKQLID